VHRNSRHRIAPEETSRFENLARAAILHESHTSRAPCEPVARAPRACDYHTHSSRWMPAMSDPMLRTIRLVAATAALLAVSAAAAAPDLERAKQLVESKCSVCHGMQGESSGEFFPRLSGQHADYIVKQLRDFREGRRKGEMTRFAKGLADDVMEGLGQYFSRQKMPPHPAADPELGGVGRYLYHHGNRFSGVPACKDCHGANGEGAPRLPRLAGQRALYLERQLRDFNKRERTNDNEIMHSVARKLTELELKALAEYISGMP
jgi:cytochrome c553